MKNVLISGGTGLIGQELKVELLKRGYKVNILTRNHNPSQDEGFYQFDLSKGEIDPELIKSTNFIIHLAGANIAEKNWSTKRKLEIVNSRVDIGKLLFEKVKEFNPNLKAFISASAIGYYGAETTDTIFKESNKPSDDFLGLTCQKWESLADDFNKIGTRTVVLRTGIVLSKSGGALEKLVSPMKYGIVAGIGSGNQYMPWIHIRDLVELYIKAIEDESLNDVYNAVAPEHINNNEFTSILAKQLNRKHWMPNVPSFLLKLTFGEMANMILKGSRVSSEKIVKKGFKFQYCQLNEALEDLMKK